MTLRQNKAEFTQRIHAKSKSYSLEKFAVGKFNFHADCWPSCYLITQNFILINQLYVFFVLEIVLKFTIK